MPEYPQEHRVIFEALRTPGPEKTETAAATHIDNILTHLHDCRLIQPY